MDLAMTRVMLAMAGQQGLTERSTTTTELECEGVPLAALEGAKTLNVRGTRPAFRDARSNLLIAVIPRECADRVGRARVRMMMRP